MCRSDHRYSIACKLAKRGRRWSVTCGFSSAGHAQSENTNGTEKDTACLMPTRDSSTRLHLRSHTKYKEAARDFSISGRFRYVCCGGVLLSHNLAVAVPLALPGLASRFGMGAGRFPGAMTTTSFGVQHAPPVLVCWGCGLIVVCIVVAAVLPWFFVVPHVVCGLLFSVGPLVPVGSRAHCCASTSGLSTR